MLLAKITIVIAATIGFIGANVAAAPELVHAAVKQHSPNIAGRQAMAAERSESGGMGNGRAMPVAAAPPTIPHGAEWIGFSNCTSAKDREAELRARCAHGEFYRVDVDVSGPDCAPANFNDLCRARGKTCQWVCDWEGHRKECDEISQHPKRDGSRIALCY